MQRKTFHKPTARPTKWPAVFHFSRTEASGTKFQFDVLVQDEEAWDGLLLNVKNFPATALKALVMEKDGNSRTPAGLTLEDLRGIEMVSGTLFREPTKKEADGDRQNCTVCTGEFQPVKFLRRNRFDEEVEAGSYAGFKTEQLATLKSKLPDVYTEAEQLTAKLLEGQKTPEKLVILLVCAPCATMLFDIGLKFTGLSRAAVVEQVLERDINIKSAIRRNAVREALGGKRRDPEDGRGRGGRPQGRDNRNFHPVGNDRPGKVNFHGAMYYAATGEVLQTLEAEGKIPKGQELEWIKGLTNEQMVEFKIIQEVGRTSQADQIRRIAQYALESQKDVRDSNRRNAGKGSIELGETKGKEALESAPVAAEKTNKKKPVAVSHRSTARRPAVPKKAKTATSKR